MSKNEEYFEGRPKGWEDGWKKPNRPYDPRVAPNPHDPWNPHPEVKDDWKKPLPPKPLTIADLFPRIDRWGIGIMDTLEYFKSIGEAKPSYPPYNIHKDGTAWTIDLAVAGFRKHELEVITSPYSLVVRTVRDIDFEGKDVREVIHQGIAQRNFELQFALAEHVEVKGAELKDGILTVKLEQKLPKEKQPKSIEIK